MKKISRKRIISSIAFFVGGILFVIGIQLLLLFADRIKPKTEVPQEVKDSLFVLMNTAKELGETPVAAIITYDDSIIASANNTVKTDSNFTRHAEINAINTLIRKIGYLEFQRLDRNKIVFYSTYEPCEMCKGVLLHTRIFKIVSLFKKPRKENLFFEINNWKHYYRRSIGEMSEEEKQDFEKIIFGD